MYHDDDDVVHQPNTAEVHLPWSDTWFNLPTLPTFTYDGAQYNITDAKIFSILSTSGAYMLYLVGGMSYDSASETLLPTKHIYFLEYNGTYHWNHESALYPDMGK